jgi:hypothetical protein
LSGNPGVVSLKQFRDNEGGREQGQKSHLINRKGLNVKFFLLLVFQIE